MVEPNDSNRRMLLNHLAGWQIVTTVASEVDEALDIARQIAEALEAAHENGVIHEELEALRKAMGIAERAVSQQPINLNERRNNAATWKHPNSVFREAVAAMLWSPFTQNQTTSKK